MRAVWSRRLGAHVIAAAVLLALAPSASAAISLERCGAKGIAALARCGSVAVPLDRSGTTPGTIDLRVRLLPAAGGRAKGTVLALAGGPGQAATPLLLLFRGALGGVTLRSHRLVAFDQRGTGGSGPLRCPGLAGADPVVPHQAVADCAAQLGPARAHYATADSVADVEAVRAALGAERLTLFGTSYGTKVALDYAAAHPDRVERLVLDSVVPPGGVDPFLRTTIGSIPRVLRGVCGRRQCPFTADAAADLAALAEQLRAAPLQGLVFDRHGRSRTAALGLSGLLEVLLAGDLLPGVRAATPAAVRSAIDGDPASLLRLAHVASLGFDAPADSDAASLATTCEDGGVPWAPGTPIGERARAVSAVLAAIPPGQLAPFGPAGVRATGFPDLCRAWPESPVIQPQRPLPDVPALIVSGGQDLRTPRADALAVAARLPRATILVVPGLGHGALASVLDRCVERTVAAFVQGRRSRPCRPDADRGWWLVPRPAPASAAALPPIPGVPPHAGRTLTAVALTFEGLFTQLLSELDAMLPEPGSSDPPRAFGFGGLHGGSVRITRPRFALRRYSYVPGVTIAVRTRNLAEEETPVTMRIGGASAARGRLRIGDRWTVGRLGGHPIRVRTAALERALAPDGETAVASRAVAAPSRVALRLPLALPLAR